MDSPHTPPKKNNVKIIILIYIMFLVIGAGIFIYKITAPPSNNRSFTNNQSIIIHVSVGESVFSIAEELKAKNIIKKIWVIQSLLRIVSRDTSVPQGDYLFAEPAHAWNVTWRLARGIHKIEPFKITLKEGITNEEIVTILSEKLPHFRKDLFNSHPKARQGYLFPDTYFLFPLTTTEEIITLLSSNYSKRMLKYKKDISLSGHTEEEIIIMASIIEKEAQGTQDSAIISGILWNRKARGMLLQVDAARETYFKKGLPQAPIANPGERAIEASLYPKDTPYVFYLHGKDTLPHYAKTYQEHIANIKKYLQ